MKYAVDVVSGATICDVPSFIKIGSGIQKLIRGAYIDPQTGCPSLKPTFICIILSLF
jgi:hypothetical protein